MVADQAAEITTKTEEITSDGVSAVAEILTDITDIGSGDVEVTMFFFIQKIIIPRKMQHNNSVWFLCRHKGMTSELRTERTSKNRD